MSGSKRQHLIIVLRSLFRHCKKTGTIFRDPTARMRAGKHVYRIVIPLEAHEINGTVTAATSPAARVAIALAGVHAAGTKAITVVLLNDVDLGNRRLAIAGQVHPLDDLTRQVVVDWLAHRHRRWPHTANPHLLVNQHTAMDLRAVSTVWITDALRGQAATLQRLRVRPATRRGPHSRPGPAASGLSVRTRRFNRDPLRRFGPSDTRD